MPNQDLNQLNKIKIEQVDGSFIPGFRNTHSHSFQYAMAGLAENRSSVAPNDSFWSWRENMYRLAQAISADQFEKLAAFLFGEMLKSGYTHVAEFHYLHHNLDGELYPRQEELGLRLMKAAEKAKIQLTLVPIFYERAGLEGGQTPGQKRFYFKNSDLYLNFLAANIKLAKSFRGVQIGYGVHSIRAASESSIANICSNLPPKTPFHIHLSEQKKEIADSLKFYNKRPVEWFCQNFEINEFYNFVHSTHINKEELNLLCDSRVNVILCPSTEANLGDGQFPFKNYVEKGGRWTIGSDSQITLSPLEELRWLEYQERLRLQKRNVLCQKPEEQSGDLLYFQSIQNSHYALGCNTEKDSNPGERLTGIIVNHLHPLFYGKSQDTLLSTLIYAGDHSHLLGVIANGQWAVKNGRHVQEASLSEEFLKTLPIT